MPDPWQWWSAERIAAVTDCPAVAIREHWPLIASQLDARNLWHRDVARGVIATVRIETARTFRPIHEYGTPADWAGYSGGARYAGRGYVQLTHDYNYRAAGQALGLDLVGNPDLALTPPVAAAVLAWYWATKTIPSKDGKRAWTLAQLCIERDWEWVRRAVQGGTAGLDILLQIVQALGDEAMTFNPNTPTELQRQDWSCSIRTVMWMLKSIGVQVTPEEAQDAMSPQYVRSDVGLLDASGAGIVAVLANRWGVEAVNDSHATFDEVAALAGRQPVGIGLRNWGGPGLGHWSAVRGVDGERLVLANPGGTGPKFGQQTLTRAEFDARGPASMVVIPLAEEVAAPAADPRDAQIAGLVTAVAHLADVVAAIEDRPTRLAEAQQIREQFVGPKPAA